MKIITEEILPVTADLNSTGERDRNNFAIVREKGIKMK